MDKLKNMQAANPGMSDDAWYSYLGLYHLKELAQPVNGIPFRLPWIDVAYTGAEADRRAALDSSAYLTTLSAFMAWLDEQETMSREFSDAREAAGEVAAAINSAAVQAPIAGTVRDVLAASGSLVEAGQPILTLVASEARNMRVDRDERVTGRLLGRLSLSKSRSEPLIIGEMRRVLAASAW